ncbi:MAG TPA: ABC transporter permease subunit [Pirellulales bacterium]|nr:ABC transporter permease subunit [Pirellulales bacterium]
MMNRALWTKAVADARLLLAGLTILMFGFNWLFVWLTSLVELGAFGVFLQALPREFESLVGVPFAKVATTTGRIALAYIDPVVIFTIVTWALARGSDAVSGEIGRGTMELLLAQPVSRSSLLMTHATVTTAGSAILAAAAWLGTLQGLVLTGLAKEVEPRHFIPAAVNVFAATFFLAAFTTLVSAFDNQRWRTLGIVGAFYIVELLLKIVARMAPRFNRLMYVSFLGAYEPQSLVIYPETAWQVSLRHDGALIGLGLAAYFAAAITFNRRDVPAPL